MFYLQTRIQMGLYVSWIIMRLWKFLPYLLVLFFLHRIIPTKFAGYLLTLNLLILLMFLNLMGVKDLFIFGHIPPPDLSDFTGLTPFWRNIILWGWLWNSLGGVLFILGIAWSRLPAEESFIRNVRNWNKAISKGERVGIALLLLMGVGLWGWMYQQLYIQNPELGKDAGRKIAALYEKRYRKLLLVPVPSLDHVDARLQVYPKHQAYTAYVKATYINRDTLPVETLLVSLPGGTSFLHLEDMESQPGYQVIDSIGRYVFLWRFGNLIAPGETLTLQYHVRCQPPVVLESNEPLCSVLPGGSLVRVPMVQIGYDPSKELASRRLRKKYGLPPDQPGLPPPGTPRVDFLGPPKFSFHAEIGLPERWRDLTVVTTGQKIREYREEGWRWNVFEGREKALWGVPSLTFAIAPYHMVEDTTPEGVVVKIYYHPDHRWNVQKILQAAKDALSYHSQMYGSYPHSVFRIAEFPSLYGDYAQSLATFIPYGEAMGFVTQIKPGKIPFPIFVMAHEVGHQWWAHQLTPAMIKGASFLTESFSEYVAIRVLERTAKEDSLRILRQLLRYEMDYYLGMRRLGVNQERPLLWSTRSSVYYHLGSVVTYATSRVIGHDLYADVLRSLLEKFHNPPPYPSALDYMRELKDRTPPISGG